MTYDDAVALREYLDARDEYEKAVKRFIKPKFFGHECAKLMYHIKSDAMWAAFRKLSKLP